MQTRTSLLWAAQAVVLLATLVLGVTPAVAVHNDGIFQVDGDAQTSTCGTAFGGLGCGGDDWDNLYMCVADGVLGCSTNMPGTGNNAAAISDLVVDLSPASIFTGGGSKDQLDITQWSWKNGSVPDKDDLIEAFAALYTPVVGSRAGDKIIYFGASRLAVNGDAQIGFWFLQNAVSLKSDGTFQDSSGGPGHHLPGDIGALPAPAVPAPAASGWRSGGASRARDTASCAIPSAAAATRSPGPGPHDLDVPRTLFFSLFLFASSGTVYLAERQLARENRRGFVTWWFASVVLGAVFLLGQLTEYMRLYSDSITISTNLFTSAFFTLTGFHGFHVLVGLIALSVIGLLAIAGDFAGRRHRQAVDVVSIYWHFVDGVWVIIFSLVYLLGLVS